MERTVISTNNAPEALGPYNHGIKASGQLVFTAGQIGLDPESGNMVGDDIKDQTRQALMNVRAVLQAAGADLNSVIKTTIFLHDINDYAEMNEIYSQYFSENPPARSAFGGNNLPKGAKVEIECIAVI